ncbi:MAG: NYN domain-containing protein [Oscillospiraceae bacterium]|jgi:hypothetical protein|nr:NYN domain-containing protein [Oscillospiraceae bacterium]
MKLEFRTLKPQSEQCKDVYTIVFIDYEYLFISFSKQYATPPMLEEICNEMKQNGKIAKIYVFGDFTKPELSQERNHVRTVTSNIIDCGNESTITKKDYTDFIMLDHIYQELIQNPAAEQFIFLTGDGHFSSSATFLRNFMEKTVGIYGITGSLSRQLRDCASWAKELNAIDGDELEYQTNLLRNFRSVESRGLYATFHKTVEHTQRAYGGDLYRYQQVLRNLIDQGYINSVVCTVSYERGEFRMLTVNWQRVAEELAINV